MRSLAFVLLSTALLAACDYPRDAEGTLERVKSNGVLHVGASVREPWVVASADDVSGTDASLVEGFAASLGANVQWMRGSESELVDALADRDIDVMIGGLRKDSPWVSEAAATEPYGGERVMLVPAGENALLLALDRFLAKSEPAAGR